MAHGRGTRQPNSQRGNMTFRVLEGAQQYCLWFLRTACRQLTENKVPTSICRLVSGWTYSIDAGLSLRQTIHAVSECYNVFFNETRVAVKQGPWHFISGASLPALSNTGLCLQFLKGKDIWLNEEG